MSYGFDKLQEHLDHSAPCSSRFDGFDRGDSGREDDLEFYDDVDPEPEPEFAYIVKHIAYCGMSHIVDEFETREEALARAKKRVAWCEAHGLPVDVITEDEEWEIREPEDCLMVPDQCGLLVIRCVEKPVRRY